jgi:hypothetical protein
MPTHLVERESTKAPGVHAVEQAASRRRRSG